MMITTSLLSWTSAYLLRLPCLPFGPPQTRLLLCLRGAAGFVGIWGFYYSLRYLALAEASIINFLAPILAVLLLGVLPSAGGLSVAQLLAGLVSMGGVVCVLQPWSAPVAHSGTEEALAIGAAMVGVAGGAVSYVAMARLKDRVHPILTVAYFSTFSVVLSGLLLVAQWRTLRLPMTTLQWGLALVLGILGFAMHWLMTASLTCEGDAKRPLNFVYTQIVFAMVADKVIWDVAPNGWKYLGGALIIGSAIFVASTKASHQYALVHDHEEEEDDDLELEISKERAAVAKDAEP
jgi:drug/metabolite transporter (DMT)-like permease